MTPAVSERPKKFRFFKSKEERIPEAPPPPRIREEDFLSEKEEEAGGEKEVLREAVGDRRRGQARAAEDLQDSLASEFGAENRRGAQDDGECAVDIWDIFISKLIETFIKIV